MFTYAIKEISLEIDSGEMVAIMGPSGSGKSTLLNIIGCLDLNMEGEYYLDQENVKILTNNRLAKIRNEKIGFVFQDFALIQAYTALENVQLPLLYSNNLKKWRMRLSHNKMKEIALDKLLSVGLEGQIDKIPSQMSGGQQQRVAIARALVTNPPILIADEPTGSLDQQNGYQIMEILKEINNDGKTVIVVTHDENVASFCNRRIIMKDGEIIKDFQV